MAQKRLEAVTVLGGTASASLSKWFLVWLFARSGGGAEAVGLYSAILAVATPIFVSASLGLRIIFLSSVEKWPWTTYLSLRIAGNFVGAMTLLAILAVTSGLPFDLGLAVLGLKAADLMFDIYQARVQYGNRMVRLGLINILYGLATVTASTLALLLTGSPIHAVIAAAAVSSCGAAFSHFAGRSVAYESSHTERSYLRILRSSVPVTFAQLFAALLFQLPIIMLAGFSDAQSIGVYSAAAYLLTAASLMGSALQVLLITPFRQIRETSGMHSLKIYSTRITVITALLGMVIGVGVIVFGSPLLQAIYGPDFAVDQWSLFLLSAAGVATVVAYIQSSTLNVINRYGSLTFAMGFSCGVSLLVGLLLILGDAPALLIGTGMASAGAATRVLLMYFMVRRS